MNWEWVLGLVMGVLAGVAVVAAAAFILRRKTGQKGGVCPGGYDERQQLARGKAFRSAYFTLLGALGVWMVLDAGEVTALFEGVGGIFICVCLSAGVFAVRCIMSDAYLSLREKPGFIAGLFLTVFLLNLAVTVANGVRGAAFLTDGRLSAYAMNGVVALLFAVILAAMGIRRARLRRDGD